MIRLSTFKIAGLAICGLVVLALFFVLKGLFSPALPLGFAIGYGTRWYHARTKPVPSNSGSLAAL